MSEAPNEASRKKIDAIYSLREAAEAKAVAEVKADVLSTGAARNELLDATLHLEAATQDAIEACHECGLPHGPGEPHHADNVLKVDFRKNHASE